MEDFDKEKLQETVNWIMNHNMLEPSADFIKFALDPEVKEIYRKYLEENE
jgi:hypothetical protein